MEQQQIETYIIERQVSGDLLDQLRSLDSLERAVVGRLIVALAPSANALRDLLVLAAEIAVREKKTLAAVLSEDSIDLLLSKYEKQHLASNKKQLLAEIKQSLFSRRYPEVAQIQGRLSTLQREIATTFKIKVELPPELEGDRVTVSLSARSEADFAAYGESLTKLAASPQLREIFAVLKGQQ